MVKILCETQDGKKVILKGKKPVLRVGVYGIFSRGQSVMVTQTYLPSWEFPGGGVEVGETLLQTLEREFKEETGIDVVPVKFILQRESFYLSPTGKVFHSFQNFFSVKAKRKISFKNSKKTQAQWVPTESLSKKNMKKSAFDALNIFLNKKSGEKFIPVTVQSNP